MHTKEAGQSLVEIIIATALFAVIAGSLVTMYLGSFIALYASQNRLRANTLASAALEGARSIAQIDFSALDLSSSAIELNNNIWSLSGEGTVEQIDNFRRYLSFSDVYRDSSLNISLESSPGFTLDDDSKAVTAIVSWTERNQPLRIELNTLLTNYRVASSTP